MIAWWQDNAHISAVVVAGMCTPIPLMEEKIVIKGGKGAVCMYLNIAENRSNVRQKWICNNNLHGPFIARVLSCCARTGQIAIKITVISTQQYCFGSRWDHLRMCFYSV